MPTHQWTAATIAICPMNGAHGVNAMRYCVAASCMALSALAYAATSSVTIPGPPGSGAFGTGVTLLPNGNVVIVDPSFDSPNGVQDVGAAYLFRPDGSLVSVLTGDIANDRVGTSVVVLANGNYVVVSAGWGTVTAPFAGAVTFGDMHAGVSGIVSERNSLVGSSLLDAVGVVVPLTNGDYVVAAPAWDDGALADVGAVVACDGRIGARGFIDRTRSLAGSHANDRVGESVSALAGGGVVILSSHWSNGVASNVGAVTRGPVVGTVGPANSLVGAQQDDRVGERLTFNANGSYVITSPHWDAGPLVDAGAATFCGDTGCCGIVGQDNSLVGSHAGDRVGSLGAVSLKNGNYVVRSPSWGDGTIDLLGAATWISGRVGAKGAVGPGNSLVGSTRGDQISSNGVLALSNGNYTVSSQFWHNGPVDFAGAATFGDGSTGTIGIVSSANSLVGATKYDSVAFTAALADGNYVVFCSQCDIDGTKDAGAVVLGDGETGRSGVIGAGNALVGSHSGDEVGASITPLVNGSYVVSSPAWSNGAVARAGALTFVEGRVGLVGAVSVANSLVGSHAGDSVGASGVRALANGNYVVLAPSWRNGDVAFAGAIMLAGGREGVRGEISSQNALVGEHADDSIGSGPFLAFSNSDFVVGSPSRQRDGVAGVGAITYLSGSVPSTGAVTMQNSLLGVMAGDLAGATLRVLSGDRYLVFAPAFDTNGPSGRIVDAGAVVPGPALGDITAGNAAFGKHANAGASTVVDANADIVAIGHPLDNDVVIVRLVPAVTDEIFTDGFDAVGPSAIAIAVAASGGAVGRSDVTRGRSNPRNTAAARGRFGIDQLLGEPIR